MLRSSIGGVRSWGAGCAAWKARTASSSATRSLACLLWFKAAAQLSAEERVDRLALVSPPASARVPEEGASFRIEALDVAAILATAKSEIRIFCSDADPYNPQGAQQLYGDPLGIRADVVVGAGHITPDSGYGPWPAIEQWCIKVKA